MARGTWQRGKNGEVVFEKMHALPSTRRGEGCRGFEGGGGGGEEGQKSQGGGEEV